MIDLTSAFDEVADLQRRRTTIDTEVLLAKLAHQPDLRASWDVDAGESWAVLFRDDAVFALVYSRAPLVLIKDARWARSVVSDEAVVEGMTDYEAPIYKADVTAFGRMFGDGAMQYDINLKSFSAHELYFWTV